MRTSVLLSSLLVLSLAACNLPNQPTKAPTADPIGTQVSQRLTQTAAAINQSTKAPTPAQPSAVVLPTLTSPAGSPAAPATATKIPPTSAAATTTNTATSAASATPAPGQTATNTASPTATQTPTATATATNVPGDPKETMGQPVWKENFAKSSTWGLDAPYDDGHTRVSIAPGKIILKSYDGNGWHGWRIAAPKVQNFYLEATIQPLTCASDDQYGLIFRASDAAKGYWFTVTCDGRYGLTAGTLGSEVEVIKLKNSPLIKAGSNQVNRLGVMAKDKKLSLYMNGKLLEEVTNDAFTGTGVFGYFIAGFKTAGFTYESTEIAYWNLP